MNVLGLLNRFSTSSVKCWTVNFCIHVSKGPVIIMKQLKCLYNSSFKNSYSHRVLTCFPMITSNESVKISDNVYIPERDEWQTGNSSNYNPSISTIERHWNQLIFHCFLARLYCNVQYFSFLFPFNGWHNIWRLLGSWHWSHNLLSVPFCCTTDQSVLASISTIDMFKQSA